MNSNGWDTLCYILARVAVNVQGMVDGEDFVSLFSQTTPLVRALSRLSGFLLSLNYQSIAHAVPPDSLVAGSVPSGLHNIVVTLLQSCR